MTAQTQGERVIDGTRSPAGYEQLTVAATAAPFIAVPVASGGTLYGATGALLYVETGQVRFRDDGVAPTATIGMPLDIGVPFFYVGDPSKLQFIRTGGTSGVVNALYYW